MKRLYVPLTLLLVLIYFSLAGGRNWLGPLDVFTGLFDPQDFIIHELRLPRVLIAVGSGAALGMAGALMQGLTRNPLATPDIIGVTQGAGLGFSIALLSDLALLPGAALGAGGAMLAVATLSRGRTPLAFVLFGIGVGATCAAATAVIITSVPDAEASTALIWLSGSLSHANIATAMWLWVVLIAGLVWVAFYQHTLALLWLGDDVMTALGTNVVNTRTMILGVVTGLTAASTLAVGPIGFLAFVSAPLAQAITRSEPPALWPAAATGACLLTAADLCARLLAPIVVFPTGLIMSLIGAPYLIFFLWRERRQARS